MPPAENTARFWDGIADRYSKRPFPDPDSGFFVSSTPCLAESIVPYRPVLAAMRWLGKAPPVEIFRADALLGAMREAGFTDVTRPDVGGNRMAVFVVAARPSAS